MLGALLVYLAARRSVPAFAAGMVVLRLLVATGAATFTGYLLPWDQVAFHSLLGQRVDGFEFVFDDDTYFVIIRGTQVSPTTVLVWLGVHALVVTPAFVLILSSALRQFPLSRSQSTGSFDPDARADDDTPTGTREPDDAPEGFFRPR